MFHDFWSVFATCPFSLDSSDSCIVKVVKLQGRILVVSVAIWDSMSRLYSIILKSSISDCGIDVSMKFSSIEPSNFMFFSRISLLTITAALGTCNAPVISQASNDASGTSSLQIRKTSQPFCMC